jgi:acetylornithine deacetylase/succinyl-diaminopimelate desuccinylase-like protein
MFILDRAKGFGMRVGLTSQEGAGWAEIGQGRQTLGILVHVDVVDVGDIDKWNTGPFELTEIDGTLYGRGVVDDKGPAIISLYCLKALLDLKVRLKQKIRLIIGTCEESSGRNTAL